MRCAHRCFVVAGLGIALAAAPTAASFHEMQIEQVVAGVCGNSSQQAIQLRQRFAGQRFVNGRELKAWDATGANPVLLITFPSDVASGNPGDRILAVTSGMASANGVLTDFTLAQPIPDAYLPGGRLTFEDGAGHIYWSLAWGNYTGPNTSFDTTNDPNADFGTPEPGLLSFGTAKALQFQGVASAQSDSNNTDYALTSAMAATLTRNNGNSTVLPSCVFGDGFVTGTLQAWSTSQGLERCDGGDIESEEAFSLGRACELPDGGAGVLACAADGISVTCN